MKQPVGLKRGYRTPFVKAEGPFRSLNAVDLSCRLVDGMLDKLDFSQGLIQHVVWGMVIPDPDIYSVAREVVLGSRLDNTVEAYSVSRACATSLQAAACAAMYYNAFPDEKTVALVGGVESFSSVKPVLTEETAAYFKSLAKRGTFWEKLQRALKLPLTKLLPVPPSVSEYSTGLTMGEHCELMVKDFKISRERQDAFALASHKNADRAREYVAHQIVPTDGIIKDSLIRADSSLAALAKLPPVFDKKSGTLTAGNSSPLTDGAAGIYAIAPGAEKTVKPDAHLIDFEFVAVDPMDGLLIGPGKAILRVLHRHNLQWDDIDYIDIHEAFAAEVLCNVDALNDAEYRSKQYGVDYDPGHLDASRLNPWGSSIAYGHPFGATGARMLSHAMEYLKREGKRTALVAACTAGALAGALLLRNQK